MLRAFLGSERVPQKRKPVLRPDTRQNNDLGEHDNSRISRLALAASGIFLATVVSADAAGECQKLRTVREQIVCLEKKTDERLSDLDGRVHTLETEISALQTQISAVKVPSLPDVKLQWKGDPSKCLSVALIGAVGVSCSRNDDSVKWSVQSP